MALDIAIITVVVVIALVLWSKRVSRATTWRAMTTPLASIIGSGFLVLGPILESAYGVYAPLIMFILCLGAYGYGAAIRYNMTADPPHSALGHRLDTALETASGWALGFAYIVSVAYYLNLFGAFAVSLTGPVDRMDAQLITTAVFAIILTVGWTHGFSSLERLEYITVTIKLAIIAGLLIGLAVYFFGRVNDGGLVINAPTLTGWPAATLAFGLIVTVQGFETSRYLMDEYDREICIRSMRWAQIVSGVIYVFYILLLAYVFEPGELQLSETAIIGMMRLVAPILPVLLIMAALAAQFSAAVADTGGSGGLFRELTRNRISPRTVYAILTGVGLIMTWAMDVFEIISYASRAFAVYYMLQAAVAAVNAWRSGRPAHTSGFAALALLGFLIATFGTPVDG